MGWTMATPIKGTAAGETLSGTDGVNDKLLGKSGNDTFNISTGRDTINGQEGYDTAIFAGAYDERFVFTKPGTDNLKTTISYAGYDTELKNVERINFSDGWL